MGKAATKDTVTIPRSEYERLLAKAGEGPEMPAPDAEGNFPAVEFLRASIARTLIRRRTEAGLSQTQLAALSGVRQETISRIESGKHTVTERVMEKIEKALDNAVMSAAVGHNRRAAAKAIATPAGAATADVRAARRRALTAVADRIKRH